MNKCNLAIASRQVPNFAIFIPLGLAMPPLGPLQKHVIFIFQAKCKFQEVFNQVATYLTLRETEYFGLAFIKGLCFIVGLDKQYLSV